MTEMFFLIKWQSFIVIAYVYLDNLASLLQSGLGPARIHN